METTGTPAALTWYDQTLLLLPERAVFWEEEQMLIVVDAHLGKTQVFRDIGIPIPLGTTPDDLHRLSRLLKRYQPRRLLFLGDLIHGPMDDAGRFHRMVGQWRRKHNDVELLLVAGNHDTPAGQLPPSFRLDGISDALSLGPFVFSHKPDTNRPRYGISGHVHPAVTASGKGLQKETLPCFCFGPQGALLPSFGSFTGTQVIRPTLEDDVYVIAGDDVIAMGHGKLR